jgi:hypothetical protein
MHSAYPPKFMLMAACVVIEKGGRGHGNEAEARGNGQTEGEETGHRPGRGGDGRAAGLFSRSQNQGSQNGPRRLPGLMLVGGLKLRYNSILIGRGRAAAHDGAS